ncbi:MAG: glycosyltransferase [Flavobacteriaceae bacterium]|nr:glycosyltransferase [Flavobacteriaceae bacterium]
MKILFEARSIIPAKSGGIENYLYMLVNAWKNEFPDDKIFIHIPPATESRYKERIGDVGYLTDNVYRNTYILTKKFLVVRLFIRLLIKAIPSLENFFYGLRKKWINQMDKMVDVVVYPFQREKFVHDPSKTIFVMHDFREWDTDGGNKKVMKEQIKAIKKSAAVIVSWPYPYKRMLDLFPEVKSKLNEIPFLYDAFTENELKNDITKGDFLYYPSANATHKNHENLIIGLSNFNRQNPGSQLKLICTGPIDLNRQKVLDKLIEKYEARSFIEFLGFVSREKVFKLYNECYAVVTSSKYEAFSGAVLEAFKFKKPVLASAIPPITEFLEQYNLELTLFDPNYPESIAIAIEELTRNYSRHLEMSNIGFNRLKNITPRTTVAKFKEVALSIVLNRKENESI